MNQEWWLHFAGWATEPGIDSLGLTATHVAASLFSLCRDYRNPKCYIRCTIIFIELTFHLESSRLLTYYILGFAAYFLYIIFSRVPVSNDD